MVSLGESKSARLFERCWTVKPDTVSGYFTERDVEGREKLDWC